MTKKQDLAIIGTGKWGMNLIRTFYNLNVLKYVCDKKKHIIDIKKKYHVNYKTKNEILRNNNIKTVIIATPINTHFMLARGILNNKKNIFVEKPLTQNSKEIKTLDNLRKKNKKILMVGHLLRYHPAFIKVQRLVKSNYLGKIKKIYSIRTATSQIINSNNIIWDYGPHDVSMIQKLIKKKPKFIKIVSQNINKNVVTSINVKISYTKNLYTKIYLSWHENKKIQKLKVIGSKKTLIFDDMKDWNEKINIYNEKKNISFNVKLKKKEPLLNECQYLLAVIKNSKIPLTDNKESKNIITLLENLDNQSKKIKKSKQTPHVLLP